LGTGGEVGNCICRRGGKKGDQVAKTGKDHRNIPREPAGHRSLGDQIREVRPKIGGGKKKVLRREPNADVNPPACGKQLVV